MRNQNKYLFIYLCVLCFLVGSVLQLAQAQETTTEYSEAEPATELEQAKLDQILAPIALYPDTLLSHILVASTYPLEVIQAARWRKENEDLDEQQALDAAESKDWDPSVKALVPFADVLQSLSEDLQWLQDLGDAFLFNEEQVLSSIQVLRQKAYAQGNLNDNEYIDVEHQEDEIVIQTVQKEVVYVPYYDTRVVYGNWWWHHHQPYVWHRPRHSVLLAGLYWSIGFSIRPSFYFGGFHWKKRHLFADYHYRRNSHKHWSHGYSRHSRVAGKEYPRWSHNKKHRRGVHYKHNGRRVAYISRDRYHQTGSKLGNRSINKVNKKRELNYENYSKNSKFNHKRVKNAISDKRAISGKKAISANKDSGSKIQNKQRQISANKQNKASRQSYKSEGSIKNSNAKKIDRSQTRVVSNKSQTTKNGYKNSVANKAKYKSNGHRQSYSKTASRSSTRQSGGKSNTRTVKASRNTGRSDRR